MKTHTLAVGRAAVLGMFALAIVSLAHISRASAGFDPPQRLAQASHGGARTTGFQFATIKKIYDRVALDPSIYDLLGCPIGNHGVSRDDGAFISLLLPQLVPEGLQTSAKSRR